MRRYRSRICCFNDDVQGTACICLAGILSALRVTGSSLKDQRFLFFGAGEAGTGIAELIAISIEELNDISRKEGRQRSFFMDSKGLVCASRSNLESHKQRFAWDISYCKTLAEAVEQLRPTALIGVSTSGGAFTKEVLELMAKYNDRPIIFPLSNPTTQSECTFEEAFDATEGRVLFASGSPFPPIEREGKKFMASQANNAYVFPAIGHAAVICKAAQIQDKTFLVAAEALANMMSMEDLKEGALFPRFSDIRRVSARLIACIAQDMHDRGLGVIPDDFPMDPQNKADKYQHAWEDYVRTHMFPPMARLRL